MYEITHYYNSNLVWRTVSHGVDEVIPTDHPRREVSKVILWYDLIHDLLALGFDLHIVVREICFSFKVRKKSGKSQGILYNGHGKLEILKKSGKSQGILISCFVEFLKN